MPEPLLAAVPSTAALEGFCPRQGGAFDGGAAAALGAGDLFLRPRDAASPSPGACEVRVDPLFADGFEG